MWGNILDPLISIIIPTFNREREISRALNSILEQTYSNWEVLVIDNSSIDETLSVVRSFKDNRIRIYNNINFKLKWY